MEGRGLIALLLTVIALLLAVIAGVLLFGRGAMLSDMRGFLQIAVDFAVFGVVIAVVWGLLSLARYMIRETLRALREAESWELGWAALIMAGSILFLILSHAATGKPILQSSDDLVQETTGAPNGGLHHHRVKTYLPTSTRTLTPFPGSS